MTSHTPPAAPAVTAEGEAFPSAPKRLHYVSVAKPEPGASVEIAPGVRWARIPLPLLQIVWTNSHTTFVLGPAFLAVFIAGEAMAMLIPALRRSGRTLAPRQLLPLASAAALVAAACWVNPYGTAGALFPAQLFRQIQSSHPLSQMVGEFLSPFAYYGVSPLFWRYPLAAALSVWALWVGRRQLLPGFVAVWAAIVWALDRRGWYWKV